MLHIPLKYNRLIHDNIGRTVRVHGVGVNDITSGGLRNIIRDERRTCRLPCLAVQVLKYPILVPSSRCAASELNLHLGAGLDGAVPIEQPVVLRPRTCATRVLARNVQCELVVAVGALKVVRHILDIPGPGIGRKLGSSGESVFVGGLERARLYLKSEVYCPHKSLILGRKHEKRELAVRLSDIPRLNAQIV